jgi:hypothetical protein
MKGCVTFILKNPVATTEAQRHGVKTKSYCENPSHPMGKPEIVHDALFFLDVLRASVVRNLGSIECDRSQY